MNKFYICDCDKKISENKCNGYGCKVNSYCFLTRDENYAKKYLTLDEIEKLFQFMCEHYSEIPFINDTKRKQYENALKSIIECKELLKK